MVRARVAVSGGSLPTREQWAGVLREPGWARSGKILKHEPGSWVVRTELLGEDVVVKCRALASAWDRLKSSLGHGRADRHWKNAARLSMKGIGTADVLCQARALIGTNRCELLVMRHVNGRTLLECMRDSRAHTTPPEVRGDLAIADAVGAQLARFVDAGLWNRDHKPSNLIVQIGGAEGDAHRGGARVVVLDCVAIRSIGLWRSLRGAGVERMLASLVIEPTGCGCLARRALLLRGLRAYVEGELRRLPAMASDGARRRLMTRATVRSLWRRVERAAARHGDPTPTIDPLAPRG